MTDREIPKEYKVDILGTDDNAKVCKSWDDVMVMVTDLEAGSYRIYIDELRWLHDLCNLWSGSDPNGR